MKVSVGLWMTTMREYSYQITKQERHDEDEKKRTEGRAWG